MRTLALDSGELGGQILITNSDSSPAGLIVGYLSYERMTPLISLYKVINPR